jgi:hypothetical protein
MTAVDEEPRAGSRRGSDAPEDPLAGGWMTTVQGADPDGEHQIERLVLWLQCEVFSGDQPDVHTAHGDLLSCRGSGLGDGLLRAIDSHDTPSEEAPSDSPSRRAGPASDLEDVKVRLHGKRVHDSGETRRQTCGHAFEAMRLSCRPSVDRRRAAADGWPVLRPDRGRDNVPAGGAASVWPARGAAVRSPRVGARSGRDAVPAADSRAPRKAARPAARRDSAARPIRCT